MKRVEIEMYEVGDSYFDATTMKTETIKNERDAFFQTLSAFLSLDGGKGFDHMKFSRDQLSEQVKEKTFKQLVGLGFIEQETIDSSKVYVKIKD